MNSTRLWPETRAAVMSVPGTAPPNSSVRVCFAAGSSASVQAIVAVATGLSRPKASGFASPESLPARLRSESSETRPFTANASAGYGAGLTMRQGPSPVRWNSRVSPSRVTVTCVIRSSGRSQ